MDGKKAKVAQSSYGAALLEIHCDSEVERHNLDYLYLKLHERCLHALSVCPAPKALALALPIKSSWVALLHSDVFLLRHNGSFGIYEFGVITASVESHSIIHEMTERFVCLERNATHCLCFRVGWERTSKREKKEKIDLTKLSPNPCYSYYYIWELVDMNR